MSKKTLKDIKEKWSVGYAPNNREKNSVNEFEAQLKQETIKWINKDLKETYSTLKPYERTPSMNIIRKWMKRLNITEEDLK